MGAAPWFASSRGYFTPYGIYPSGAAWLTDYYLSNLLAVSFDGSSGADASLDTGEPDHAYAEADTPISPGLKDAITEEIRLQLVLANSSATGQADSRQTELPSSIRRDRIFVVSAGLEVVTEQQQTCALSAGDALLLTAPPSDGIPLAKARVASSKRANCPAGIIVSVSLESLQEMQNDLRAEMDNGLAALHDNQGRDGWPQAPPSALSVPPHPALDRLPPADPTAAALLEAQRKQAAQTEATLLATAFSDASNR